MKDVTSKRVRNATELMLRIPVRAEFVQGGNRLTSFATRLKMLLNGLFELRKVVAERERLRPAGPIDSLQSIYATKWGVIERPAASELMVATAFDGNWEDYFQSLVDDTGELLDAIFCHCEGYAGHGCQEAGFEPFVRWIRKHQVECSFFYTPIPDLSTNDLRHARNLLHGTRADRMALEDLEEEAARVEHERAMELLSHMTAEELKRDRAKRVAHAVTQFYKLRAFFPKNEMLGNLKTRTIFDRAAMRLFSGRLTGSDGKLDLEQLTNGNQSLLPDDVAQWIRDAYASANEELDADKPDQGEAKPYLPKESIQGNILQYYDPLPKHGCIALVQCDDADAVRNVLRKVHRDVTHAGDGSKSQAKLRVNVGLTYAGLERLELDPETLALLPKDFKEGMAARCGAMGDVGYPNHPSYWELPTVNWIEKVAGERVELSTIDVVLLLQDKGGGGDTADGSEELPFHGWLENLEARAQGARVLHVQPLERDGSKGHFGLVEKPGVSSQPVPKVRLGGVDLAANRPERDQLALGEFLLGHPNQRGRIAECAEHDPERFENGSFLVLRKIEQHTDAFEDYKKREAKCAEVQTDDISAWMLGRKASGEPLMDRNSLSNDFDYASDADGKKCPLHAHIRRANPRRDRMEPRIMRRSFGYKEDGSNDGEQVRGLIFMAYNASIARQYEVVQRWLNGGNSTGLPSVQNDLLTGAPQPSTAHWVIDGSTWKTISPPPKPLTSLRWGLYLFVPSMDAIETLAENPGVDRRLAAAGKKLIAQIDTIGECDKSRHAWKQVIEEDPRSAAAVWEAIRAWGEPKWADGYGLLVADLDHAKEVLSDPGGRYSVCEYQRRLHETIGMHYLALDPKPKSEGRPQLQGWDCSYEPWAEERQYEDQSRLPNRYLLELDSDRLYRKARAIATQLVRSGAEHPLDLARLVKVSIAELARDFIGIPATGDPTALAMDPLATDPLDPSDLLKALEDFVLVSRYSFYPHPEPWLKEAALAAGQALKARYGVDESRGGCARVPGAMADELRDRHHMNKEDEIAVAVMGAIVGFAAPAVASTLGVLKRWLESGELWRLRMRLLSLERNGRLPDEGTQKDKMWAQVLVGALSATLQRAPMPPILYRTALPRDPSSPEAREQPVVLGLKAIAAEARQRGEVATPWVFGGARDWERKPAVHGCPARDPALAMMRGIVDTLLRCRNVRQRRRLTVEVGEAPPPFGYGPSAPKQPDPPHHPLWDDLRPAE